MVYWVKDATGRFAKRPHYQPKELDELCEATVGAFLRDRRGRIEYPISTEDLTVLIERHVEDLDLYADLSADGPDVEGVTRFVVGKKPSVGVAEVLSVADRRANRLRTTLAHEFGHAVLHDPIFQDKHACGDLFALRGEERIVCKRDTMVDAPVVDWMEWQAGYASGAFLMPKSAVLAAVRPICDARLPPFQVGSDAAERCLVAVIDRFLVSRDAARVRLLKLGVLTHAAPAPGLFG